MKKIVFRNQIIIVEMLVALVILSLPTFAQPSATTLSLTLSKAREIAAEKNPELAAGVLDEKINKEATAEAKLKKLPQLYADLNLQRNLIIPVTPVPANAFNPNSAEGELIPLKFTTKWTSNAGINAGFDLFNPPKKQAVDEALIKEEITRLENTKTANDLSFEVGKAYITALISAEQLRLAAVDTLTKVALLKISQQQFDEGRLMLSTLYQVISDRNKALNNFEEAAKIYANSEDQLLYILGFSPGAAINIEFLDSLESLFQVFMESSDVATINSFSLDKLKLNEALLNTQIKASRNSYLPAIALKGYYGANYFDNYFDIYKSPNWYGNSYVKLEVKIPIIENLDTRKRIKQLSLQIQANQLRYNNERNKNRLDYLAAKREALVYKNNYLRTLENFKLAEKSLLLAEQQFANGRLLLGELHQISYNYQKEKNNYLNMTYNYILAKLTIEKLRNN